MGAMQTTDDEANDPASRMSRRRFLGLGAGLAGAAALAPALAPGLSEAAMRSGRAHRAARTKVNLQFVYLENTQFAGSYFAEAKGYYAAEGLAVTLLPGGPNIAPEPIVATGKALAAITHTNEAVQAINNGAPLKIIGAGYQKNPFCLISRASAPIRNPRQMIGKKIGVSTSNEPVWKAFLAANKISPSKIDVVTVQFDPTPLASGEIDGLVGFYTNEPIILRTKGTHVHTFLLNDYGFPELEELYIVREADLKHPVQRKHIVGLMRAESKGWAQADAHPAEAAHLATYRFGKSLKLDYRQQVLEAKAQVDLVESPVTKKKGLFWMEPSDVEKTLHSLSLGGVKGKPSMFTNEILHEVYGSGHKA